MRERENARGSGEMGARMFPFSTLLSSESVRALQWRNIYTHAHTRTHMLTLFDRLHTGLVNKMDRKRRCGGVRVCRGGGECTAEGLRRDSEKEGKGE